MSVRLTKRIVGIQEELRDLRLRIEAGDTAASLADIEQLSQLLADFQQNLLKGAENAQTYLDMAGVILVVIDSQCRVSYINRKGCEILEVGESEIMGHDWLDFVPPDVRGRVREELLSLLAGRMDGLEYVQSPVLTHAGRRRVVAWHYRLLRDKPGTVTGLLGSGDDVTDRRQVEAERDLLTHAVEEAGEAIIITDAAGAIVYVNPFFERLTGYTRQEVLGRHPGILKSGKQDQAFYQEMRETLQSGHVWRGHMVNRRKDGSLYEQDSTISAVKDASGKTVNYVEVQRDVTEQVEMESRLRQSAKMEAIGQLAGGVAHDFNNQLTVIKGYCELLLKTLPAQNPMRDHVEEIHRAAERSASLTSQLLAFSRKQMLFPQVVDLNAVLVELSKTLGRLIGERIRLKVVCGADRSKLKADPGQLQQAIMNLVINARDAMPEGGQLTLETANVELDGHRVGAEVEVPSGRYVVLAITDTGTGMDPQTRRQIFEPFFTTKAMGKGTGLGLSVVHGFVKQSGGRIAVYSEPGHGTTFRVYLPELAGQPAVPPPVVPGEQPLGTETILVAEDEDAVRTLTVRLLEDRGYRVLSAANGEEAIAVARNHKGPIDLLVTDVVMPGLAGPQLAERLLQSRPELKVLFTTGYARYAVAEHQLTTGEHPVLTKPFSSAALSQKVREAIYGRQPSPELSPARSET